MFNGIGQKELACLLLRIHAQNDTCATGIDLLTAHAKFNWPTQQASI